MNLIMSQRQISLDSELINQKFKEGDYIFCIDTLEEKFRLKRNDQNEVIKIPATEQTLLILDNFIDSLTNKTRLSTETEVLLLKQCFHSLRNCICGEEVQNQIFFLNNSNIIENCYIILNSLLIQNESVTIDCLRMELQFISNLIAGNKNTQIFIWNAFSEPILKSLYLRDVANVTIYILCNIFNSYTNVIPKDLEFSTRVLFLYTDNTENAFLLLEVLIRENVITKYYNEFSPEFRLALLENIYTIILEEIIEIPVESILILIESFKKKSDCILKTVTDYIRHIEPLEVARLLDCIASISGREKYLGKLQADKSLLINCIFLLKSLHETGKTGDNHFSSIQKLSEMNHANQTIQEHPGFGFKAALTRVIGNLCSKHKENQTLIRELDGIPLLMDCCNMDARNPLIIQWVILAVRNLCENNPENQALIAEISKVGVVESAILQEMGLTLHDEGSGKEIGIAPLHLKK